MSLAAVRSFRGDEYQLQVALDWVFRLLSDDDVLSVQVESLGAVGHAPPRIDDIVVRRRDRTIYIQAKKNHPKREVWSLRDAVLQAELVKARDQLESDAGAEVRVYSQSPFGAFEQLCDEARYFPDYAAFVAEAPGTLRATLASYAAVIERDTAAAFDLVRRVWTKRTLDFDDWERDILRDLRTRFARPGDVADLLARLLSRQQARLEGSPLVDPGAPLTRADLEILLKARGHVRTPDRSEAEMLMAFARASKRGRIWKRDVDGHRFPRAEVDEVVTALAEGARSVVVTSGPGGGKTCVLLDVVERLEADHEAVVLFIKGDQFDGARTLTDLADRGLPDDIVGQASRLAVGRRVTIVIDALDVLSLQRTSGTLTLFLGLLDDLLHVQGVSVVAACRDFDLRFAPQLRDRTWDRKVPVGPLPVDTVGQVLREWGLVPESINPVLLEQLRVPQHLRLYGQLVSGGVTDVAAGPYALHDRFLDVVVEQSESLGPPAMEALYKSAERLQDERRLTLPRAAFPGDAKVVEGLLSAEVLIEPRPGILSFSHQEILDCVAVRAALRRGQSLLDFLLARPALPFLQPTARTFLFMLRASDTQDFRRQARRALDHEGLAYHLRRLIAESLAEVVPEDEDRRLVRFLMQRHPDLFERFASRLKNPAWLPHIRAILDDVRGGRDAERWTVRLLTLMNVWAAVEPEVVVGAWHEALDGAWPGVQEAHWGASSAVRAALKGDLETGPPPAVIGDVIRQLIELPDSGRRIMYELGEMVHRWVEAVNGDDDLVQMVLERDAAAARDERVSTDFKGEFLESRLLVSDELMDWVYGALCQAATDARPGWRGDLLESTSYRGRHSRGMMMAAGDEHSVLVRPFERALVQRAERNDGWWRSHETELRTHSDWGLQYLAMQGYAAAPERHASEIASVVSDPEMLGRWSLDSEVRELAYAGYPYFTDDEREAHQQAVLAHYLPDDEGYRWRARNAYEHLTWVPPCWRTLDAQAFLDKWEPMFGPFRPEAEITGWGGMVPAPFGTDQLLSASDDAIVRCALFFGTDGHSSSDGWGNPVGSWDQVVGVFGDAASRAPVRMVTLLPRLIDAGVAPPYLDAVVGGLGNALRYRFGNVSRSGWTAVEEHEDGEDLGRMVLRLLERFGDRGFRSGYAQAPTWQQDGAPWLSEHTACDVAQGCEAVLSDPDDLARLTLFLVRLSRSPNPESRETDSASSVALNSVRGQAAETAVQVAGTLLAAGAPLPDLLCPLLLHLAADPVPGVRWSIVHGLLYLTQFDEDLGWSLAERSLADGNAEIWKQAERLLYHNYYRHFPRVAPFLDDLRASGLAPGTYGRISMLAALAGHLDADALLGSLAGQPDGVWKGVAQVLVTNLSSESSRDACTSLLRRLLSQEVPPVVVATIANCLDEEVRPFVSRDLIELLIDLKGDDDGFRWTRIAEWIEAESARDPASAARALTRLAESVERTTPRGHYGSHDELGRALSAVLREADESDDPEFIRTAIGLQGALVRRGLIDEDALFEAAARG